MAGVRGCSARMHPLAVHIHITRGCTITLNIEWPWGVRSRWHQNCHKACSGGWWASPTCSEHACSRHCTACTRDSIHPQYARRSTKCHSTSHTTSNTTSRCNMVSKLNSIQQGQPTCDTTLHHATHIQKKHIALNTISHMCIFWDCANTHV